MNDDLSRGCLENGEPLEALYGVGWWTPMPEQEPDWTMEHCPYCGQGAHFWGGDFVECQECGAKHEKPTDNAS